MKNNNYLMLAAIIAGSLLVSCSKKDLVKLDSVSDIPVVQVQNALLVMPTSSWCPPVGTYALPALDQFIEGKTNVSVLIAHIDSPALASDLGSQTGQDLALFYGASNQGGHVSIPKFAIGNNIMGAFTNIPYTVGILEGFANEIYANTSVANSKLDVSFDGDVIKVKSHTKFFEAGEAGFEYKISIILTEDNIVNRQNFSSDGYKTITHNDVCRATLSNSTIGDTLLTGTPTAGQLITKDFSYSIAPSWVKSNLTVIAVIWKVKGTTQTFVNVDKIELN